MDKEREDISFVYYRFKTDVGVGLKTFIYYRCKPEFDVGLKTVWEAKYGYCKFNKLTEEFELDIIKTDTYFLTKDNREAIKVKVQLILCKQNNLTFPDIIDIATV